MLQFNYGRSLDWNQIILTEEAAFTGSMRGKFTLKPQLREAQHRRDMKDVYTDAELQGVRYQKVIVAGSPKTEGEKTWTQRFGLCWKYNKHI